MMDKDTAITSFYRKLLQKREHSPPLFTRESVPDRILFRISQSALLLNERDTRTDVFTALDQIHYTDGIVRIADDALTC